MATVENRNGVISSVGSVGRVDTQRSEGRAYLTHGDTIQNIGEFVSLYLDVERQAYSHSRRRWVLRARITEDVLEQAVDNGLPIEAYYPLRELERNTRDVIVFSGSNIHETCTKEIDEITEFWGKEASYMTPSEKVASLREGYSMSRALSRGDIDDLTEIWTPFGWSREGVADFIENYPENSSYFSGIRVNDTGRLTSACMAESIDFAGVTMYETTEYGTQLPHRGKSLCTIAVVGLIAQILEGHSKNTLPLVVAEFNTAARSDVVGRHVGMIVPELHNRYGVWQVLEYNVSVMDDMDQNDLNWADYQTKFPDYESSFNQENYRYWRNFVPGMLPMSSINAYYDRATRKEIIRNYQD